MPNVLIITVGTRQVGWQCQDGQIRCLSTTTRPATLEADPIAYLYNELGVPRSSSARAVRHLGELLYQQCQAAQDFSAVQLLFDQQIIEVLVAKKLQEIWLIASDQAPEVPDFHRSGDTVWLAALMAGKIQQTWPNLPVKTHLITTDLGDSEVIRDYYASLLLQVSEDSDLAADRPTIWVQTKGSTPGMSAGCDICVAALARDANVWRMIPQEPTDRVATGIAEFSTRFDQKPISQYFWPLEKPKIISAWERGDFGEAKVWLQSHQSTYGAAYKLAEYLERATRQNLGELLKDLRTYWLNNKIVKRAVNEEQRSHWQTHPCLQPQAKAVLFAWESAFQMPIHAAADRPTDAFFLMAQTLERLLSHLYDQDRWRDQGWITLTPNPKGGFYQPRLEDLMAVWVERYDQLPQAEALDKIRGKRNRIAHDVATIDWPEIEQIWQQANWPIAPREQLLLAPLKPIAQELNLPDRPLLSLLYDWGLDQLRA